MRKSLLATILAFAALPVFAQSSNAPPPNELVRQTAELLHQKLEGRKQELATDREALYGLIDGILLPRFDRRYSAQLVLGRHWRSASEEQRQRFIDAFYGTMLRRYADGVLEFDLNQLEVLPYRGDPSESRTMVRTRVELDDGTSVPVDYALLRRDSRWKVFDVRIEGVSYVRRFRTEFNSEIRATSLDAVIERLEGQARKTPPEQQQGQQQEQQPEASNE